MGGVVKSPLAIAAVVMGAALLVSFVAGYSLARIRAEQVGSPELGPIDAMPSEDLPGQDLPSIERYPGAVRVKYESHLLGDERVSETDYLAEGGVGDAQEFYEPRLDENGWALQGSDLDAGERVLRASRGKSELLVELEQEDELVEIEMELTETLPP